MIELKKHIEILLLDNDCVIVPGLGGFMAHHVDARYEEAEGIFLPPLRTLGFNPRLTMNDSLLVQSYIEAYDISYPEALRHIEAKVVEIRQHLETEGSFELNGLGVLLLNDDGNIEFEPCEAGILTSYLYGLSSYEFIPLPSDELKATENNKKDHNKTDSLEANAITIKMSWMRNVIAVAAAILAFFIISTPVANNSDGIQNVQQSAFIPLPQHHDTQEKEEKLTATSSKETETIGCEKESIPSDKTNTIVKETLAEPAYTIVLASHVTQRNAEIFIAQLSQANYKEARLQASKTNVLRVVYGSYNTQQEAFDSLRSLRKQSDLFYDAWVLEVK